MPLTQFYNGQTITGIDFGNVQNGDTSSAMDAFLKSLGTVEPTMLLYEDGDNGLFAGASGDGAEKVGYMVSMLEGMPPIAIYATEATEINGITFTEGYQNLTSGKYTLTNSITLNVENGVAEDTTPPTWNGVLMGAYTGEEPTPPTPEEDDDAYIGYCITPEVVSDKVVKISVPQGGLHAGQVVNCVSLADEVYAVEYNSEVYTATQPTTDTLDSRFFAMVVNGGLEELADGRRPDGQPNYTKYVYKAGDVCDGVILDKNLVFEIGLGSVGGTKSANPKNDIGKYIVPANGSYTMTISDTATAGGCLKIIGTRYFALGGMFGSEFSRTYVAIAIN